MQYLNYLGLGCAILSIVAFVTTYLLAKPKPLLLISSGFGITLDKYLIGDPFRSLHWYNRNQLSKIYDGFTGFYMEISES